MRLSNPLTRYRIMAWIVGVMLIFVFLFAHVGHTSIVGYHTSVTVEKVIGPVHGALYIVYLFTVLQLWIVARLRLLMVALMVTAGWLPFTAFIAERWVTRHLDPASGDGRYTLEVPGTTGTN
jgi:integral membrane protein